MVGHDRYVGGRQSAQLRAGATTRGMKSEYPEQDRVPDKRATVGQGNNQIQVRAYTKSSKVKVNDRRQINQINAQAQTVERTLLGVVCAVCFPWSATALRASGLDVLN